MDRIRIPIIAERLRDEPDDDCSVFVPTAGEIGPLAPPITGNPIRVEFDWDRNYGRRFPAVQVGNFYMLWIDERRQWVGIFCSELSSHFEGDYWGREVTLSVSGPYKLSEEHGRMILEAYSISSVSSCDVLITPPTELA